MRDHARSRRRHAGRRLAYPAGCSKGASAHGSRACVSLVSALLYFTRSAYVLYVHGRTADSSISGTQFLQLRCTEFFWPRVPDHGSGAPHDGVHAAGAHRHPDLAASICSTMVYCTTRACALRYRACVPMIGAAGPSSGRNPVGPRSTFLVGDSLSFPLSQYLPAGWIGMCQSG